MPVSPRTVGVSPVGPPPPLPKRKPDWRKRTLVLLVAWAVGASAALGWSIWQSNVQVHRWNTTLLLDIGGLFQGANTSIGVMLALEDAGYGDAALASIAHAWMLASDSSRLTGTASPMDDLGLSYQAFSCVNDRFFDLLAGIGNQSLSGRSSAWEMYFVQSGIYLSRIHHLLSPLTPDGSDPLVQLGPASVGAIRANVTLLMHWSYENSFGSSISSCETA